MKTTESKPTEHAKLPGREEIAESLSAQHEMEAAEASVAQAGALAAIIDCVNQLEPKIEFGDAVPCEKTYFSIGYCCQSFQLAPVAIRELAKRAGVKFALVLNDVPHFDGSGLLAMNRYLRELRARKEAELAEKESRQ